MGTDLVETQPITYKLEIVEEITQQMLDTLECGIILWHVMKQLFKNKKVTTKFDATQAQADLVIDLLYIHGRSWTLECHYKWTQAH